LSTGSLRTAVGTLAAGMLAPTLTGLVLAAASAEPARAQPGSEPADGLAQLAVEVLRGAPAPPPAPEPAPLRVHLVLDVTTSTARAAQGPSGILEHARRLLASLGPDTEVAVHALGAALGGSCTHAIRIPPVLASASPDEVAAWSRRLRDLAPHSEGSLADALERVRSEIEAATAPRRHRVVLLTDLGAECGGDLCAAASSLVRAGARLEVEVWGRAPVPACLSEVPAGPPSLWAPVPAPADVEARIAPAGGGNVVRARADGREAWVPAGRVVVDVALDPPLRTGPLALAPAGRYRLFVLDFPAASPPVREWTVERVDTDPDERPAASRPAPSAPAKEGSLP
jgi:hypothetical protein